MGNKKTITVEITETLQRQVKVRAADPSEAIAKVEDKYYNQDIVLDASDYIDTDFNIIDKNGEKVSAENKPTPKTALEEKLLAWANSTIDQQCEDGRVREMIAELLSFGFTPDELRNELKFDANDVQQVLDEREKLPREITVTLDELSLDCLDDVNKVEEAISNYLLDTYGYYSDSHEWECGDDVDTIDVYNIEWDTTKK